MPVRTLGALARNAVRPGYPVEMLRKVVDRAGGLARQGDGPAEGRRWAVERCAGAAGDVARALGPAAAPLWAEAVEYGLEARQAAWPLLAPLRDAGVQLGGGGDQLLLYFLTRWTRPQVVVETGVAAGWSSRAVLTALDRNGTGALWSTDFPLFRLRHPEQYVGLLVPEHLRARWHLHLGPDRVTVPRVLREAGRPELVHYDSDKSRRGRDRTLDLLWSAAVPGATVVVDDIDDNLQFRDWTGRLGVEAEVLTADRKHVGLVVKPPD